MITLRERISDELLPYVQQPGQYIGGEFNQLVHAGDWERADVRVALAFPDTYAIGMSHLGLQILYWICNHMGGVCAERVYAPWIDAERIMRERGLPLFTWDTRQPVGSCHLLAISLQYEMCFTNVLTMLDLAGIPFRSEERTEQHPIVIGGGPQADNPEPVAAWFDLIIVGDGEDSMPALVGLYRQMKKQGCSRRDFVLEAARQFDWAYAPSLYDVQYHADGTIAAMPPSGAFTPREQICRCQTHDFEHVAVPERPLVPFIEVVHDRVAIEVMRGCPGRCRFCHAGYTKRPIAWRSVDRILDIAEQSWRATGQEEIGLLSLSTADYPYLRELAQRLNERFSERHVNLSIPSLRVDQMLADIPVLVSGVRKGGITIAAEAADDDLRAALRKKVTDASLFDGVKAAYKAGWNTVKLYFMCGFPGETDDDIAGIFELAREVSLCRRAIGKAPAAVNASVSWFVPKPHTPLQWVAQQSNEYFLHARQLLRDLTNRYRTAVHIKTHRTETSILEAVFARGDRRLTPVIEAAYRLGCRMDSWSEQFSNERWQQAFEQTGIDPAFYAHRERPLTERLPWDHIRSGSSRAYLVQQYQDFLHRIIGR